MFCKNCGKQIDDKQKFCDSCGAPVSGEKSSASQPQSVANVHPANGQPGGQGATGQYNQPTNAAYQNANNSNTANAAYQAAYNNRPQGQTGYQPYATASVENPLAKLSSKIKTGGIIWIVIASLQFIFGLYYLILGLAYLGTWYEENAMPNIVVGVFILLVGVLNLVNSIKDIKYSKEILSRPVGIVANFTPVGKYVGNLIYNFLLGGVIGIVGSIFAFVTRSYVLNNSTYFQSLEANYLNQNR